MSSPLEVQSPNVHYTEECIESQYSYETTKVQCEHGKYIATPEKTNYTFRTQRKVNDLHIVKYFETLVDIICSVHKGIMY